jgi:hypothetical protein
VKSRSESSLMEPLSKKEEQDEESDDDWVKVVETSKFEKIGRMDRVWSEFWRSRLLIYSSTQLRILVIESNPPARSLVFCGLSAKSSMLTANRPMTDVSEQIFFLA